MYLAVTLPALVAGHGSIVMPPPRNAMDGHMAPWNGTVPVSADGTVPFDGSTPWCPVPSAGAPQTPAGRMSGKNGQACFWFNAGCAIGCKACDGVTRGPIPDRPCKNNSDPREFCRRKMRVCEDSSVEPTLPSNARTVNTDVEDGAADDWYQYSPWRAPGSAAVFDPCGVAGGTHGAPPPGSNPFGIVYLNTTNARAGDLGSSLPWRDTGVVWTAGDVVDVSWTLNANHGGGYYYRLCRLPDDGSPVTEACFQRTPLVFMGNTRLRWNGDPASDEEIDNVRVATGTTPKGSIWAMNPIPRNDSKLTGASFAPLCKETCTGCSGGRGGACTDCRCTGEFGPANLEIVDRLTLPWMLPAGRYVLGWRWDAEESNQVWTMCSDVTIKAHPDGPMPVRLLDDDDRRS